MSAFLQKRFGSLISRVLLLTVLALAAAESLTSYFWMSQFSNTEKKVVLSNAQNLARNAANTITFFQRLPNADLPIVLEQLRVLQNSPFFVSVNKQKINVKPVPDSQLKLAVLEEIKKTVYQQTGSKRPLLLEFSNPDDLHVIHNNVLLKYLSPDLGASHLIVPSAKAPILVLQMQLDEDKWLYLAALLPPPYLLDDLVFVSPPQLVSIFVIKLILIGLIYLAFLWLLTPLKNLASAAEEFSIDFSKPALAEQGTSEIIAATRAFNQMQEKLQRYIDDREVLFRSVSHDLKTPITRLRLRAELLDDEKQTDAFNVDLDDLEMLVQAALKIAKETDIHEEVEEINLQQLLLHIVGPQDDKVTLHFAQKRPYRGKHYALKRCLSNLIDNGIKYGDKVDVYVKDSANSLVITIQDQGPGIKESELSSIFTPYVRLHGDKKGHGLGLGIAKNIIQAHGGEIRLFNHFKGGLVVCIVLPNNDHDAF